jgi:ATP-dependent DNA helicase RecG
MNLRELRSLVAQGESDSLEFKATTGQRSDGVKTVCAMFNGLGGHVIFGVTSTGEIKGQDVSTATIEDIHHELRKIEPPAFPEVSIVSLRTGKKVIALSVPGGSGLFMYDGRPYERRGPTTVRMPAERYQQLFLERMHASHRWENQAAQGLGIEDLDHTEIIRTIEEAIRRGRMEDPGTRDPAELLLGLHLIYDGQLLNAAVVLFGRPDRLFPQYPQCLLRMARFRGTDKTEFIDNRQEIGNIFQLLIRAQRFLRDNLPVAGRVVPNLFERVDDPLYPPEALREALANALCHRDYRIGGGAVNVAIFDDRLEITSTGPLPFGLTPEDLTRPHQSRPWNQLIANVLYLRGIIEQWGRGTIKMAELTQEAGLVPPQFDASSTEVTVRFRPTRYVPPMRVGHDLSPLQRELLAILAQTGPAALGQVMSALGDDVSQRTVQDNLQLLRRLDLVEVVGVKRGARWTLKGLRG